MNTAKSVRQLSLDCLRGIWLAFMTTGCGIFFGLMSFGLGFAICFVYPTVSKTSLLREIISFGFIMGGIIQSVLLFHVFASAKYMGEWARVRQMPFRPLYPVRRQIVQLIFGLRDKKTTNPLVVASYALTSACLIAESFSFFYVHPPRF